MKVIVNTNIIMVPRIELWTQRQDSWAESLKAIIIICSVRH